MANVELLLADAAELALSFFGPTWGIYLNGVAVIQPASPLGQLINSALAPISTVAGLVGLPNIVPVVASTVDFEFAADSPISNYQQEQGAFQSYDKVTLPYDVKMRLACQGNTSQRQAFLSTCIAIKNSFALFDVVTPELPFTGVNCTHIFWDRNAKKGATLIVVELGFAEIPVNAQTAFTNTAQPGESAPLALGNVQPSPVGANIQTGFSSGALGLY